MAKRESKKTKASKTQKVVKENIKSVSLDKLVEENRAAVVTSDYQKYLRKLMKQSMGKN